ncbi:MAG: biotin carboxylase [Francisellaceae bacterium]|jgi:biotin carboxylase
MSKGRKIAIIGANEFQNELIIKANKKGIETHVFAWESGDIGELTADYFYPISITELDQLVTKCKEIGIDSVASIASDLANIAVNYIGEKLCLPCNGISVTDITTNKFLMRRKLLENHLPVPFFCLISDLEEVDVSELSFPLIVKPIDRSGSRGITKVYDAQYLTQAILKAQKNSFIDTVLLEDYIDGREYSVEAISSDGKHQILQITEKFTTGSPNFIEIGHIAPARLLSEEKRLIFNVIYGSLNALGIKHGASHSEVKINSKGEVFIIEIGSRMGGDFIGSYLVESNTGFDFVGAVLNIALGKIIPLEQEFISQSEAESSLVWYFLNYLELERFKKDKSLKIERLIKNADFNGKVSSSNERMACALFKLPQLQVQTFLNKYGL